MALASRDMCASVRCQGDRLARAARQNRSRLVELTSRAVCSHDTCSLCCCKHCSHATPKMRYERPPCVVSSCQTVSIDRAERVARRKHRVPCAQFRLQGPYLTLLDHPLVLLGETDQSSLQQVTIVDGGMVVVHNLKQCHGLHRTESFGARILHGDRKVGLQGIRAEFVVGRRSWSYAKPERLPD